MLTSTVPEMTRRQILRRVGILCCHCLRNLAFYEAGWQQGELIFKDQFWVNTNSNFLDICVLEWCKLFGDRRGKHHWRKVITDHASFLDDLLRTVNFNEAEFDAYIETMRDYRDKFIAHLDAEEVMHPPELAVVRKSVSFLYDYLIANQEEDACFNDAPTNASSFYKTHAVQGKRVYQ